MFDSSSTLWGSAEANLALPALLRLRTIRFHRPGLAFATLNRADNIGITENTLIRFRGLPLPSRRLGS